MTLVYFFKEYIDPISEEKVIAQKLEMSVSEIIYSTPNEDNII